MATKTISIKENVYNLLMSHKREGESFSDLLERLAKIQSPLDLLASMQGTMDLGDSDKLIRELQAGRRNLS